MVQGTHRARSTPGANRNMHAVWHQRGGLRGSHLLPIGADYPDVPGQLRRDGHLPGLAILVRHAHPVAVLPLQLHQANAAVARRFLQGKRSRHSAH